MLLVSNYSGRQAMILNKYLINVSMYMICELTTWRLSIFPTNGSKVQSLGFQRPAVPAISLSTCSTTNYETRPIAAALWDGPAGRRRWKPNSLESSNLLRPIFATAVSCLFSALRIPGSMIAADRQHDRHDDIVRPSVPLRTQGAERQLALQIISMIACARLQKHRNVKYWFNTLALDLI